MGQITKQNIKIFDKLFYKKIQKFRHGIVNRLRLETLIQQSCEQNKIIKRKFS